jgi:hypothetical protein
VRFLCSQSRSTERSFTEILLNVSARRIRFVGRIFAQGLEIAEEQSIYQEDLLSGFWSAAKYYGFQNTFKYENDRVILDKYTIVEKTGFKEVYNWLQHFSTDDLDREFRDAGFSIEERYSDVAGGKFDPDSIEFAIIASQDPA